MDGNTSTAKFILDINSIIDMYDYRKPTNKFSWNNEKSYNKPCCKPKPDPCKCKVEWVEARKEVEVKYCPCKPAQPTYCQCKAPEPVYYPCKPVEHCYPVPQPCPPPCPPHPQPCPPETKKCPCTLFQCNNKPVVTICPEVQALLTAFDTAVQNGVPFASLNALLTDSVVLKINFPTPPLPLGLNPAVGITNVNALLTALSAAGPLTILPQSVLQEDCYKYITTGTLVQSIGTDAEIRVPIILKTTVACENGILKISFLELWGDLTTILPLI